MQNYNKNHLINYSKSSMWQDWKSHRCYSTSVQMKSSKST